MQRRQKTVIKDLDQRLTDLMKAVIDQDVELVMAILESGADLEVRDRQGQNVLYHALPERFSEKSMMILKLLVSKGVNINASMDSDGCSALVTAVVMNLPEVVTILIENDVNVNEPAMSKFYGCLNSDPDCQQNSLMDSRVTSQIFFSKGCGHSVTPLLCSVMNRRHELAQMLVKAKAQGQRVSWGSFWRASGHSVCSNCEVQITPLHMAAYIGDLNMTHLLLNHTQDDVEIDNTDLISYHSYNEICPLWFSLLQGHESVVKLFLTVDKPIAPPCHFGSGLQVCLQEGHVAVAHMILRAGYNLEDDMDWIETGNFPTEDEEVIAKIVSLVEEPRPLLECCSSALREKFGVYLPDYLSVVGAPNKVCDILDFNDLSRSEWKIPSLKQLDLNNIDEGHNLQKKNS